MCWLPWLPRQRRPLPSLALGALLLALLLAPTWGWAQTAPLRLGIWHPRPHLCQGQEPTQRDLRVLRLAYGLPQGGEARLRLPWFLGAAGPRERPVLRLDARALYAPAALPAVQPWQAQVLAQVPALAPPPAEGADADATFVAQGAEAGPFWASRLQESVLLPFLPPGAGEAPRFCRDWPAGVTYQPAQAAEARLTYVLHRPAGQGWPALLVQGYAQPQALWADFGAGRLDVALLQAPEVLDWPKDLQARGTWARGLGTQQVLLRWRPDLARQLTLGLRKMLSQALNRPALATAAAPGEFAPAQAFLEPVLARPQPPDPAFQWDGRPMREAWQAAPHPLTRLRLLTLAHPILEGTANRMTAQWQKTLQVAATFDTVEPERLISAWASGGYDLLLTIADLDNGSLQDLWEQSLDAGQRPQSESPAAWEAALRAHLPYLPLLSNLHWTQAQGPGIAALGALCPGCPQSGNLPALLGTSDQQAPAESEPSH